MKRAGLVVAAAAMVPMAASGQAGDAAYCNALAQKYQAYVGNAASGGSRGAPTLDAQVAIEQCKSNPAGAIPVLEGKLRDARIDLPVRPAPK
jgi:hypothetical protein